ncbi:GNAT family N-acetyltransferase [Catelliglobosispora koreensis]|uniref:GNAT family N-acetyltransferase n=1 Tax=Catelliglobosispora koreensis TaxID=129052 RepID=UPI00037E0312|nr:GNAT family N-acetyltransferase [Catelliglobosispora koreensis]
MDRAALVSLAQKCLLPDDAAEASAIVDALTRDPIAVITRFDGDTLIGAAVASSGHKDATAAHLDLLLVDPAHQRQGIATSMLEELETKVTGYAKIVVRGNAPDYAWPGVDVRYTPAICTLQKLGYVHDTTAWNMSAPLPVPVAAKDRPLPPDIVVRRAAKEDLSALLPVVLGEWGQAWVTEIERSVLGAGGVHLAIRGNEPVAFAAWGGCHPSYFGPMGTLPSAGGLGLGSILLRRCLDDQAALGLSKAQIGWVGPVPFYSSACGAFIERVFFLFAKPLK